jgi:hypothetical protein
MPAPIETGLTVADLARYETDDGRRYELIDGGLYVSPAALLRHQWVAGRIFARLLAYVDVHGRGLRRGERVFVRTGSCDP